MKQFLERVFVRYGGGSQLLHPITRSPHWNWIAWTLIGLFVLGWIALLVPAW